MMQIYEYYIKKKEIKKSVFTDVKSLIPNVISYNV